MMPALQGPSLSLSGAAGRPACGTVSPVLAPSHRRCSPSLASTSSDRVQLACPHVVGAFSSRLGCRNHTSRAAASRLVVRSQSQADAEQKYAKTAAKALEVNLNPLWYGVLAEIGAGQEVARWFFRVGGAAGTVAKSISAYDMTLSDSVYGACNRYVTEERLVAMLDFEYLQCNLTLRNQRGSNTAFFAFADTVVAKAFNRDNECHGWLGIKYQASPRAEPNQVILHVRMLDKTAQLQQEALGILGVNLVHSALTKSGDYYGVIKSLMDDLGRDRIEVDLINFSGADFKHVDNRYAALTLVSQGLCDAALFSPQGVLQIPHETLYKKNILLVRGRFRPFTLLHNDMLVGAAEQFFCDTEDEESAAVQSVTSRSNDDLREAPQECVFRDDTLVLTELSVRDMMEAGDLLDWTSDKGIQEEPFIQRIDALSTMGYTVLLSNFRRYFSLAAYVSTFTNRSIVIAMGLPSLQGLFDERYYRDLDGGILEAFGRLLKFDLKLYVYPTLDSETGELVTTNTLQVDPVVQKLYEYIRDRGTIVSIQNYNRQLLMHGDVSQAVTDSIRLGTDLWEKLVPRPVAEQIKSLGLLGYRPPEQRSAVTYSFGPATPSNGNAAAASNGSAASADKPMEKVPTS